MREIMISIQPRWVELIASGKKTVEVRRTRPKCETPFKCYIYETKDNRFENMGYCWSKGEYFEHHIGKVIGEFVCDKIITSFLNNNDGWFKELGRLSQKDIDKYQGDKAVLYGWHITDLVVYDEPRELSEFTHGCPDNVRSCSQCKYSPNGWDCTPIKTAPQSWFFVNEKEPRQTAD